MRVILIVISIFTTFHLAAQHSYRPSIKTLTTKEGLSSDVVHAIHKDNRGFIWIGTEYGLNRYDGQEFDFFSKDNQEHMTINSVHKIADDGQGHLWILKSREKYDYDYTSCELNIFDIYSNQAVDLDTYFKGNLPFETKDILFLQQLDSQSIFIQVKDEKAAFVYTRKEGFKRFPYPKSFDFIRSILRLPNGEYLISGYDFTQKGYFYRLSVDGSIIEELDYSLRLKVTSKTTTQTYNASGFWTLPTYEHLKKDAHLIKGNTTDFVIQSAYNSQEELFWMRLKEKLLVINQKNEVVFELPYESIEQNIRSFPLFFDGERTWFSDGINGIQIITLEPDYFQNTIPFDNELSNSMRGILKDKNGNTWFSSGRIAGKFDKNNQLDIFSQRDDFTGFLEDEAGNVWWKLNRTLHQFNSDNNQVHSYPIADAKDFTWTLASMHNGEIWMSGGAKVIAFNPTTETFREVISFEKRTDHTFDFYIYDIQEAINDHDKIWICTNRGLFFCSHDGKILAIYNDKQEKAHHLPAFNYHHLYQPAYQSGRKGNETIWLATGDGGLFQLSIHQKHNSFDLRLKKQFTVANGLSSNALHSVYEDAYGYLWLSSDNGLMQFDKSNEQITKYFRNNGNG